MESRTNALQSVVPWRDVAQVVLGELATVPHAYLRARVTMRVHMYSRGLHVVVRYRGEEVAASGEKRRELMVGLTIGWSQEKKACENQLARHSSTSDEAGLGSTHQPPLRLLRNTEASRCFEPSMMLFREGKIRERDDG